MGREIEIEIKSLITKDEYDVIINHFLNYDKSSYIQINYYIDTSAFSLMKLLDGLRIRKKKEYELTYKTPLKEGLLEINQIINEKDFLNFKNNNIFPNGEVKEYILNKNINPNDLKILSTLSTFRIDIKYKNGLLSIDKNEYNNNIDYEIEYECDKYLIGLNIIKDLFKELNINFKENKKSKLVRAMDHIRL